MKRVMLAEVGIKEAAELAARAILEGKVVAVPTDTVYGLVGDATSGRAVRRIFQIKGRERGKPLPVFVKDIAMAKKLAKVSLAQERVLKKAWPGKVTFILESRGKLARETGTSESLGLRIPRHELVFAILEKTKRPLTGTSANRAGRTPLAEGRKVAQAFRERKHKPAVVIDAGKLLSSRPSKVIDIRKAKPVILRT